MTTDLTGGIDPGREYVFAERPDDPEMRDSASFWVLDDAGRVALPRIGIEAVAANWDHHELQVNVVFPDGRAYRLRGAGDSLPPDGLDGRPTVLGAGGLVFRCEEPFRTWTLSYEGQAVRTSSADLVAGKHEGPAVDVSFHVVATMAVPPWAQGSMLPQARERLRNGVESGLIGGPRYEQLFRATGRVAVEDGPGQPFTGTGLRIRRQGVRRLAGFWGHCWQSAVFGSGKAFGYIAYPPRDDGQPTYAEGFVYHGSGSLVPARVVVAPWLTHLRTAGEDVSLVLETDDGTVEIAGETVATTHDVHHDDGTYSMRQLRAEMPSFPALQQAGVRYRWDGEEAYGMLERSNPLEKLDQAK